MLIITKCILLLKKKYGGCLTLDFLFTNSFAMIVDIYAKDVLLLLNFSNLTGARHGTQ